LRLAQEPVNELTKLREELALIFPGGSFADADNWLSRQRSLRELLDVEMTFSEIFPDAPFVIKIHAGPGEVTAIAVDPRRSKLVVDRTHSGLKDFHPAFSSSARHEAPVEIIDGQLAIRFLLDTSSLEVFAQNGRTTLTELIFPIAGKRSLSLSSEGGDALSLPRVDRITIYKMKSAVLSS
jgi:fructan beta-fructosidase